MLKSKRITKKIIIFIILIILLVLILAIIILKDKSKSYVNSSNEVKNDEDIIYNEKDKYKKQENYILTNQNNKINKKELLQKLEEAENGIKVDKFLTNIKELETLAIEFKEQNEISSTVLELCLQYIRKDKYNNDAWKLIAGNVNKEFIQYVEHNSEILPKYKFQNVQIPNSNVDFVHMCASLNAIIYKNSIVPKEYAGWAGDLVTLMGQIVKYDNENTQDQLIEYGNKLLGANSKNTLFNERDLIADIDSINISKNNPTSIYAEIIGYYYKENTTRKYRETEFKKYLLEKEKTKSVYEAVKSNFNKNKIYVSILLR